MSLPALPSISTRRALRVLFAIALLLSMASLAGSYAGTDTGVSEGATRMPESSNATSGPAANDSGNDTTDSIMLERRINGSNVSASGDVVGEITVVATQGFYVTDERAELVAFDGDGDVIFHDDRYRVYFDVDPVPGRPYTVQYVAAKHRSGDACPEGERCTRNVVERANLRTGAVTRIYAEKTPGIGSTRWHDVDRLNETHYVVADVYRDGVFVVNASGENESGVVGPGGRVVTRWNASSVYTRDMGGKKGDWTHINDVEVLDDGRIVVSPRNMDQVLFLDPCEERENCSGYTVNESWSLGRDGNHEVLYEQHNPDYIPAERGGPALLVADSENNRVVEYQRLDGAWRRTWSWRDVRLQWPRDADRLPNDNTLVVDTHGDRVAEVTPDGDVVWRVHVGMPYDAERLGTGDESAGGRSMRSIRSADTDGSAATNTAGGDASVSESTSGAVLLWLKDVLPSHVVNSALYVSPDWMQFAELVTLAGGALVALCWGGAEWRWSARSLRGGLAFFGRRLFG